MNAGTLQANVKLNSSGFDRGFNKLERGFKKIHNDSIKLNQSFELLKNTWAASADAMVTAFEVTERAAKKADMEATFDRLSSNMGRSSEEMLKQMGNVTKGAMSEMDMMARSTQAMMAGMDFNQITTAFQYLQRYAKATNKDFNTLSGTIMDGLSRGSTQLLDDAGIIIDQTSFIAEKERELGRSFSDVEKKAALVTEAIAQMSRKMGALGTDTMTTYDHIQKMKAEWQNFVDFLGSIGLKVFGGLKASFLGWKAIFLETEMAMAQIALAVETNYKDIAVAIRTNLMDALMAVRDMLNKTSSALSEFDNPAAQAAASTANAMSNWFNEGAIGLFESNMDTLTGTTKTKLEAHISVLKKKRGELRTEIEELNAFLLGKTATAAPNSPTFDLSASVGGNETPTTTAAELNAQAAAMDELQRTILSSHEYEKWRLQEDIAEFKKNVALKRATENQYQQYRKAKLGEIEKLELQTSGTIADGWKQGWKDAMKDMNTEFEEGAEMARQTLSSIEGSFSSTFKGVIMGDIKSVGEAFDKLTKDILGSFVDMFTKMLTRRLMMGVFGGMLPFAKGGAFADGKIQAYASGGLVDSPTFFSHSGGIGLMGEAGTEAIMPLTRASNGDLGVKAVGGAQRGPVAVQVAIVNEGSGEVEAKRAEGHYNEMGELIVTTWIDAYHRNAHGLRDSLQKM